MAVSPLLKEEDAILPAEAFKDPNPLKEETFLFQPDYMKTDGASETPERPISATEMVITQATGLPDKESVQLKDSQTRLERDSRALSALANIPQPVETFKALSSAIQEAGEYLQTFGHAAAKLIQKNYEKFAQEDFKFNVDTATAKEEINAGIIQTLGKKGQSFDEVMKTPSEVAKTTALILSEKDARLKKYMAEIYDEDTFSFNDLIEYANPIGGEDPNGMDIEVWNAVKGILTGTFDAAAFDEQMESNYGEDWGTRFFAFAVKEVAIDGALLLLAATVIGKPIAVFIGITRMALLVEKLRRVATRAVFVGVGGGAAQGAQNYALDRDINLALETGVRTGGYIAGEVILRTIKHGIRSVAGRNRNAIVNQVAKDRKVVPIGDRELSTAFNGEQFAVSPINNLVRAQLVGSVDRYQEVMGSVAKGIFGKRKATKEVRESLAAVLGKDARDLDQIDMDVILNDAIILRDLSENARLAAFSNQDANSRGLGWQLLGGTLGARESLNNTLELFFKDTEVMLRHTDNNLNLSDIKWMDGAMKMLRVSEASRIAGKSGSNYFFGNNFQAHLAEGFRRIYKNNMGHLTGDEKRVLSAVLKQGDADETVYDLLTMTPRGMNVEMLTPRIIEAYNKQRFTMDLAFDIHDKSLVSVWKDRVKLYEGTHYQVVNAAPGKLTGKQMMVREFDIKELAFKRNEKGELAKTHIINKTSWARTDELKTLMNYRNGHMPRAYASHNYSIIVLDVEKNTVSREAMFNSNKEAEQFILKRAETRKATLGGKTDKEVVLKLYNNGDTGLNGVTMSRAQLDLFNVIDDESRISLQKLLEANGIEESRVKFIFDNFSSPKHIRGHPDNRTDLGTATTRKDKELRIALAAARAEGDEARQKLLQAQIKHEVNNSALPTQEAYVEYLSSVAHDAGFSNFRRYTVESFMDQFKDILATGSSWGKPMFKPEKIAANPALVAQARTMSRWMQKTFSRTTHLERKYDFVVSQTANFFAKRAAAGHTGSKAMSWLMDHSPIMSGEITSFMRFFTAFPKLLTGNMAQTVVQMSQIVPSLGAAYARRPGVATMALLDIPAMGILSSMDAAGKTIPRILRKTSAYRKWRDLIQSGYTADLTVTDTLFGMQRHMDPSFGRLLWEKFKLVGSVPFRIGEGGNRVTAFTLAHALITADVRAYTKALAKGRVSEKVAWRARGLEGQPMTTKDLGTTQFQQVVAERASITALSMGKAGELELMSGFGSVAFQFRQVLPKTASIFDSSQLEGRQRFGALGAMIAAWGTGAIILGPDILAASDWVIANIFGQDKPKDRMMATDMARYSAHVMGDKLSDYVDPETTERFLKHGLIAALSEGDINFSNRISLGSFVGDMVNVSHPTDLIVFLAVAKDMYDAAISSGIPELLNPVSFIHILGDMSEGATFDQAVERQFPPGSLEGAIGKRLLGDTTTENMTLQLARDFGAVYSQLGSISRALDAAYQDVVMPEVGRANPYGKTFYSTRNLRPTDVEVSDLNQTLLIFGISPGKLVESRDLRETEMIYKEAAKTYAKNIDNRFRKALGDRALQQRLIREFTFEMNAYRDLAVRLGISPKASLQGLEIATTKLLNIILGLSSGDAIRNGRLQ